MAHELCEGCRCFFQENAWQSCETVAAPAAEWQCAWLTAAATTPWEWLRRTAVLRQVCHRLLQASPENRPKTVAGLARAARGSFEASTPSVHPLRLAKHCEGVPEKALGFLSEWNDLPHQKALFGAQLEWDEAQAVIVARRWKIAASTNETLKIPENCVQWFLQQAKLKRCYAVEEVCRALCELRLLAPGPAPDRLDASGLSQEALDGAVPRAPMAEKALRPRRLVELRSFYTVTATISLALTATDFFGSRCSRMKGLKKEWASRLRESLPKHEAKTNLVAAGSESRQIQVTGRIACKPLDAEAKDQVQQAFVAVLRHHAPGLELHLCAFTQVLSEVWPARTAKFTVDPEHARGRERKAEKLWLDTRAAEREQRICARSAASSSARLSSGGRSGPGGPRAAEEVESRGERRKTAYYKKKTRREVQAIALVQKSQKRYRGLVLASVPGEDENTESSWFPVFDGVCEDVCHPVLREPWRHDVIPLTHRVPQKYVCLVKRVRRAAIKADAPCDLFSARRATHRLGNRASKKPADQGKRGNRRGKFFEPWADAKLGMVQAADIQSFDAR